MWLSMADGSGRDAAGAKGSLLRADHQECDCAPVTIQTEQTGLGWCFGFLFNSVFEPQVLRGRLGRTGK